MRQNRRGSTRGHPRVHRLQSVRIPDAAAGVALLHAKPDLRRGISSWLASRTVRPDRQPVLVVGAGPAGMECAMVLGKRGYTVHLRDCAPELGGHWRDVARYPRCSEFGRVISYRQAQLAKL